MPMQDTQKSGNKPINVSEVPWQENRRAHGHGRRTKDEGRGAYLTTWEDMACDGQANPTHAIRMRWKRRRSMGGRPAIN